jgi:hypothetical protein
MKNKSILLILVLMLALAFSGCGETVPPPQDTPVPATLAPAEPLATEAPAAQPAVSDTPAAVEVQPTETQPPAAPTETTAPTLAPTFTLEPTLAAATPETAAATQTPSSSLDLLPREGQWGGGSGTSLIISFLIGRQGGQATVGDLGLLWFGPEDCTLNLRIEEVTPIQGSQFTRFFTGDDYSYRLTGKIVSDSLIEGVIKIDVEGCGAPTLNWRATPKTTP